MDMLLGFIRIVPLNFGFKASSVCIKLHRGELGPHDAFQRVHNCTGPQPIDWIGPGGSIAQAERVVIAIRETKPHEEAPCRLGPERVDQLLS